MDLNDAEILLIKNFLHKRMTPAEEQAFNARVDTDTEFRSEVDFFTNMFATLRDQERDRLKKMLEELDVFEPDFEKIISSLSEEEAKVFNGLLDKIRQPK